MEFILICDSVLLTHSVLLMKITKCGNYRSVLKLYWSTHSFTGYQNLYKPTKYFVPVIVFLSRTNVTSPRVRVKMIKMSFCNADNHLTLQVAMLTQHTTGTIVLLVYFKMYLLRFCESTRFRTSLFSSWDLASVFVWIGVVLFFSVPMIHRD